MARQTTRRSCFQSSNWNNPPMHRKSTRPTDNKVNTGRFRWIMSITSVFKIHVSWVWLIFGKDGGYSENEFHTSDWTELWSPAWMSEMLLVRPPPHLSFPTLDVNHEVQNCWIWTKPTRILCCTGCKRARWSTPLYWRSNESERTWNIGNNPSLHRKTVCYKCVFRQKVKPIFTLHRLCKFDVYEAESQSSRISKIFLLKLFNSYECIFASVQATLDEFKSNHVLPLTSYAIMPLLKLKTFWQKLFCQLNKCKV